MTKAELSEIIGRHDERIKGLECDIASIKSTLARVYITVFSAILSVVVLVIRKFL